MEREARPQTIATMSRMRSRPSTAKATAAATMRLRWIPEPRPSSATSAKSPAYSAAMISIAPAISLKRWRKGAASAAATRARLIATAQR